MCLLEVLRFEERSPGVPKLFPFNLGTGNTNNAVESFNKHFKAEFLYNKKYPMDQLVIIICRIIRFYSTKDMHFQTSFSPEAKHKKRALSLTDVNALIGRCYYPNPYQVVQNLDGTFTWTKGFPLPDKDHKNYVVCVFDVWLLQTFACYN